MRNKICSANQNLTKIAGNVLKQVKNHSYKFEPDRTTGRVDTSFELRRRRRENSALSVDPECVARYAIHLKLAIKIHARIPTVYK